MIEQQQQADMKLIAFDKSESDMTGIVFLLLSVWTTVQCDHSFLYLLISAGAWSCLVSGPVDLGPS